MTTQSSAVIIDVLAIASYKSGRFIRCNQNLAEQTGKHFAAVMYEINRRYNTNVPQILRTPEEIAKWLETTRAHQHQQRGGFCVQTRFDDYSNRRHATA